MNNEELRASFKEIQNLLSEGYKEKKYLDIDKFDKYYIEEFCRLLFYIVSELNDDINNLLKDNKNIKSEMDSLNKEIKELSGKIRR